LRGLLRGREKRNEGGGREIKKRGGWETAERKRKGGKRKWGKGMETWPFSHKILDLPLVLCECCR